MTTPDHDGARPGDGPAASPCVKVCTLDQAHALCLGCGRTLSEIARWGGASEPERRAILAELPARLARRGGDAPSGS